MFRAQSAIFVVVFGLMVSLEYEPIPKIVANHKRTTLELRVST